MAEWLSEWVGEWVVGWARELMKVREAVAYGSTHLVALGRSGIACNECPDTVGPHGTKPLATGGV